MLRVDNLLLRLNTIGAFLIRGVVAGILHFLSCFLRDAQTVDALACGSVVAVALLHFFLSLGFRLVLA